VPIAIYNAAVHRVDGTLYFDVGITFAIIFTIQMLKNFIKQNNKILVGAIGTMVVSIILSLIFNETLFSNKTEKLELYLITSINLSFTLMFFLIFYYLVKIIISSNILYMSANFEYMSYYRSGIAKSVLMKYIKDKKISRGIVCIFDLEYIEPTSEERNKEIIQSVLENLSDKIKNKSIMFNVIKDTYGFFIPLQGGANVAENNIKEIINKVPRKYMMS